jgi:Ca2+-binding EF-hand superfamily protein
MKTLPSQLDDIEELFDQADEDGDDQIGLTEFRGLMRVLDRQMRDEVASVRFIEIDTNRDGRIGFSEFRTWWLGA